LPGFGERNILDFLGIDESWPAAGDLICVHWLVRMIQFLQNEYTFFPVLLVDFVVAAGAAENKP